VPWASALVCHGHQRDAQRDVRRPAGIDSGHALVATLVAGAEVASATMTRRHSVTLKW
jgi:hypothetical protein